MAGYIFKKKSRGKTYYYAGESERVGKTTRRKWEVYLGSFDKIVKTMGEDILIPDDVSSTPYGLYSAFVETAKEIDFVEIIDEAFPKRDQGLTVGEYFLLGILARLTKPITKSSIQEWYKKKEIRKIYPIDPGFLTVQNYWNNMDSLDFDDVNELHHRLLERIDKDYAVEKSYIYFDPSNFHTFIKTNSDNSTIPQNGNSKKKRFDLRQVNLALAVTKGDGIPVYHKTYPGNINDVTFFKENLDSFVGCLRKNNCKGEIVIVFDKGNNSQEAFDALTDFKKPAVKFIGSVRPSTQKELFKTPIGDLEGEYVTDSGNVVLYKEISSVKIYEQIFRGVLTYDENTCRMKEHTWMKNMNNITNEMEDFIESRLNIKKWRSKEAVEEKLEEITSQKKMKNVIHCSVHGKYGGLYVSSYCDIESAHGKMNTWGKNLIITSCKKEDIVEIIKGYRMKNNIEECFKILNNSHLLSVQPFNHWTDQMIKAHMANCIFGLELIQLIRKKLRDAGIKISIEKIFASLMEIPLVQLHYKNKKTVYKVGSVSKETKMLTRELNVKMKT
ncbi:MAG: IS1634 family transposase [Candidatus Thermoplasmatota archaeon]|nr:IS1634 family transposase [Candidatus Thermoplasmatota archaeon]